MLDPILLLYFKSLTYINKPESDYLALAAHAAHILDIAYYPVHLNVLKFIDCIDEPVSIHLVILTHVILYQVTLNS